MTEEQTLLKEMLHWETVRRDCLEHPAYLLDHVKCIDTKSGDTFEFQLLNETDPWYWQRPLLDAWISNDKHVVLKARQLGVTWLAAGLGLWTLLYRPGTKVLIVSINETEASKVVNRLWDMLLSLPRYLWNDCTVIKPSKAARPYTSIELKFPDGRISSVIALASTKSAGHGETAALVILDEYARQEYARETWNAVVPTMADGGRLIVISTANGISTNADEGNFYHYVWRNSKELVVNRDFLSWRMHPDRDDEWFRLHAAGLPSKQRAEQYPDDPDEAFILTGDQYFDSDSLFFYRRNAVSEPLYSFDFLESQPNVASARKHSLGHITVYDPPGASRYAIGADVATGRGSDFSCATVVDLQTMQIVAEFHGKLDADLYAMQLHYLGKWYGDARIAVEIGGGYGEAVIIALRDGRDGRPPYPMLYRHSQETRIDRPHAKQIGFPMTMKTRPLVLSQMEQAIRERVFDSMPDGLISECQTFVHKNTLPSPRAQDGCNDDRVMSCAIALELYRRYGTHTDRWQPPQTPPEEEVVRQLIPGSPKWNKRYPAEPSLA